MFEFEKKKIKDYIGHMYDTLKNYKAFIAGGAITSLMCNREINDVDIYFRSKEDVANFIRECIGSSTWIVSTTNKATLFTSSGKKYQIVHFKYFNTAEEIFDTFDFTVCMGAFDFEKEEFVLHEDFLKHNSQRLLKFNSNTPYPIVSALRIRKYEEKQYQISKPEYLRILLTCLNLKINNYEELKEQIGGMYGLNYDNLLKPQEGEEFDLLKIIDKIQELVVDDKYFDMPDRSNIPNDIEDLAFKITGVKRKVFKLNNNYYYQENGSFYRLNKFNQEYHEEIDINTVLKPGQKFYKYVKKVNSKYISHYDNKFEYIIGEIAVAKGSGYGVGIYCGSFEEIDFLTYNSYSDTVLMELELLSLNDIEDLSTIKLKKAKVVREVPESEYKQDIA